MVWLRAASVLGGFIALRLYRSAGSILQTSIRRALDAVVQISAFVKLKLAHCACVLRPAPDYNPGYLFLDCIFNGGETRS
jgi:hypothetical protein